jgi:hypothetical protein
VKVLQYSESIDIYYRQKLLVRYHLPAEGVKNQKFSPPGKTPKHQPWNRKKPTALEEKKLRSLGSEVNRYLDFVFNPLQIAKGGSKTPFYTSIIRSVPETGPTFVCENHRPGINLSYHQCSNA